MDNQIEYISAQISKILLCDKNDISIVLYYVKDQTFARFADIRQLNSYGIPIISILNDVYKTKYYTEDARKNMCKMPYNILIELLNEFIRVETKREP